MEESPPCFFFKVSIPGRKSNRKALTHEVILLVDRVNKVTEPCGITPFKISSHFIVTSTIKIQISFQKSPKYCHHDTTVKLNDKITPFSLVDWQFVILLCNVVFQLLLLFYDSFDVLT